MHMDVTKEYLDQMYKLVDDCIFFSYILIEDLESHGNDLKKMGYDI